MTVSEGETYILVGVNESGKSTILKLCAGLLAPDKGSITLNGREISGRENGDDVGGAVPIRIGFVFQHAGLISNMTVFDNIALPLRFHSFLTEREISEKVIEKLSLLGIEETMNLFPAELSQAKKKLAGITRALIMNPLLLILDEPTGMLDPQGFRTMASLIKTLRENLRITMLISVHSAAGATSLGDHICVLKKGKLMFCGSASELDSFDDPYLKALYY